MYIIPCLLSLLWKWILMSLSMMDLPYALIRYSTMSITWQDHYFHSINDGFSLYVDCNDVDEIALPWACSSFATLVFETTVEQFQEEIHPLKEIFSSDLHIYKIVFSPSTITLVSRIGFTSACYSRIYNHYHNSLLKKIKKDIFKPFFICQD